jgi:hypothetical protein
MFSVAMAEEVVTPTMHEILLLFCLVRALRRMGGSGAISV